MKTLTPDSNFNKSIWQEKGNSLYAKLVFKDFLEAFEFMETVAGLAEEQEHHPKWLNEWNKVEIWLSTHEAGNKMTKKDYMLAKAIDDVYSSYQDRKTDNNIHSLNEAKLYTDGGSRGNPGPSAAAYVICKTDDSVVKKYGIYLGVTTNNQAEYRGLEAGLKKAVDLGVKRLMVSMDSELIVKQLNGIYKIKNQDLLPVYQEVKRLAAHFEKVEFIHIPRELNKKADAEVNRVLDEKTSTK